MDLLFFSVLCLLCLCRRLFICALWSPAGKGLKNHGVVFLNFCGNPVYCTFIIIQVEGLFSLYV